MVCDGILYVCAKDVGGKVPGWSLVQEDTQHVVRVGMERDKMGYDL